MWPWEHAALGYLLFSLLSRSVGEDPPSSGQTGLVVLASQVPDLVDKPLSWGWNLFPTGFAIGHSVFVALPVGLAILWMGRRNDSTRIGAAFVIGYWSHLLGDVVSPLRDTGTVLVGRVLWPVFEPTPYDVDYGLGRGFMYLGDFLGTLTTDPTRGFVLYLLFPLGTVVLWMFDGSPGTDLPRRSVMYLQSRFR